jgi:hypothetical protein
MSRQVGLVLGVSILVAVLGSPTGFAESHAAFQHGWWAIAAMSGVGMVAAFRMTPRNRSLDAPLLDLAPARGLAAPMFIATSAD